MRNAIALQFCGGLAAVVLSLPALAQDDEDATYQSTGLKPDFAVKLAQAAMHYCR